MSVSIHIRRGDYIKRKNIQRYSNICTEQYYDKAISYIKEKYPNAKFYAFSDDIKYLNDFCQKRNIMAVNTDRKMEDVEEMMLMSKCKHNIIANSTFSWWASWLNKNYNKIVIAPSIWLNDIDYKDIYRDDMTIL